jgi:large subunit ribosomal protein L24
MKLKKGDPVIVLTGKDKGKEGTILRVLRKDGRVVVEGVNMAKKHQRPVRATMQAGIIDKDMPMDASNVAYVHKGKPTRLGYKVDDDGKKVRVAKRTGEVIS